MDEWIVNGKRTNMAPEWHGATSGGPGTTYIGPGPTNPAANHHRIYNPEPERPYMGSVPGPRLSGSHAYTGSQTSIFQVALALLLIVALPAIVFLTWGFASNFGSQRPVPNGPAAPGLSEIIHYKLSPSRPPKYLFYSSKPLDAERTALGQELINPAMAGIARWDNERGYPGPEHGYSEAIPKLQDDLHATMLVKFSNAEFLCSFERSGTQAEWNQRPVCTML